MLSTEHVELLDEASLNAGEMGETEEKVLYAGIVIFIGIENSFTSTTDEGTTVWLLMEVRPLQVIF